MLSPKFILGFIAGEGSFTTTCAVSDDARFGVYPSMNFKLNVKEREILENIHNHIGLGSISEIKEKNQWAWRITSNSELKEFSSWILKHAGDGFKSTNKWDSFIVWNDLLDSRSELLKSKDGVKEFIDKSRTINSDSARTACRSIDELKEIVDNSTTYICGEESTYTDKCRNVVESENDTCGIH